MRNDDRIITQATRNVDTRQCTVNPGMVKGVAVARHLCGRIQAPIHGNQ